MFGNSYRILYFRRYAFLLKFQTKYSTEKYSSMYDRFCKNADKIAVIDNIGSHKYKNILYTSSLIAKRIKLSKLPQESSNRICFLFPNDATYVSVLIACWISGNIAVPLSTSHPESLIEYFIQNSQSKLIITNNNFSDYVKRISLKLNIEHFVVNNIVEDFSGNNSALHSSQHFSLNSDMNERGALIIYTSGSTGLPKGVVLTHGNLHAQISSLSEAWEINSQDTILHTLPLHHMHGIMNALLCILNFGGTVIMRPKFVANEVWTYFSNQNISYPKVNLFYGVPTMYMKLIEEFKKSGSQDINYMKECCTENIRLMTSGSAALPEPVFKKWKDLTGHSLLERFGMSEIGMALSNPLKGQRIPGYVGKPLPQVQVRIVEHDATNDSSYFVQSSNSHTEIRPHYEGKAGELLVKGPNVFKEYWNNVKATNEAFTTSGWFKTGDTACVQNGYFKILGRSSVDIIKSGGYKISALQVEACLMLHPVIIDCAVLGIPDEIWGEKVSALLVTENKKEIPLSDLKEFCKNHLPSYAVPTFVKYVDKIPRNIMGKMNKRELKMLCL